MINQMDIHQFIRERSYLIWYTQNYDGLDAPAILEATLNYGDWDDVQKLIAILGVQESARIFREYSRRSRSNYRREISNYFELYFNKYA